MAEIEHFVDPNNKDHPKFSQVWDMKLPLWSAELQEVNGKMIEGMTLKEAVETKLIGNQTIAYFMARTYIFLTDLGIYPEAIRFRQHRSNEMAHYANECWDGEIECSYGWIEVCGHSDRSCFDLSRHAAKTKVELVAARPLKTPMKVQVVRAVVDKQKNRQKFQKRFKAN